MVVEYRGGKKEEWKIEGLCWLHRFELGMPKEPFSRPED